MLASSNVLRLESYIYYIYAYTSPPPFHYKTNFYDRLAIEPNYILPKWPKLS